MKIKSIIIILVVLIILVTSYFLVTFFLDKNKDLKFENYILEVDSLIKLESFHEIDSLLLSGESLLSDSLSYKRILKRIYLLKKWDKLSLLAEKAYKKFPSDNQILAIYLYSLKKVKKYDKAYAIIENVKKTIIPDYFKLETNLFLGKSSTDDNIFYQVLEKDNTFLYKKLFEITNDNSFLINKVALDLKSGEYNEAEKTLSTMKKSNFNKLYLLTKYSNKKYEEVSNLLLIYDYKFSKEDLSLINIDISLKQNSYINAFDLIKKFIYFYPDHSPDPYINLINLKSFIDIKNMDKYIKYALLKFPTNQKLLYTVVDYYEHNNNDKEAIELITKYLNNSINNKEIEIILKQFKGTDNPDKFINNLYELVNLDHSNNNVSRYLAWNLYENNEFNKLEVFLNNFDINIAWVIFFSALISTYEGQSEIAVDQFKSSFKIEKDWESIFNQGVIYEHIKNYQDAIEHFQNAENQIENTPENLKIKSLIRTSLAYLYYDIKDYDYAYRQVVNAIDQDGKNLKAYLLLKKLESSTF